MTITINDVNKIARMIKLDVTGQEETLAKMFSETIDYIAILDELNTKDLAETYQVTGTTNIFQQTDMSAKNKTLSPEQATLNANKKSNNLIETSAVFNRS